MNTFGVFRAFYRGHFSHDFRAQGVTLKSKALTTKCIFQIYSQLLDIWARLVLKTAKEVFVPSVYHATGSRVRGNPWAQVSSYLAEIISSTSVNKFYKVGLH